MNILTNFHHSGLILSFYYLCRRMGWKLHLMYGMDWYDQGYFRMYPHPKKVDPDRYFARRYLVDDLDLFYWRQPEFPEIKFLTLEQAKETNIDILLCSNQEMEIPLENFRFAFKPEAKLLRQVGNLGDVVNTDYYKHCLFSDLESYNRNKCHKILYHQEFNLNIFSYEPPNTEIKNIYTFQNNYRDYEPAENFSFAIQRQFPEFTFKEYGRDNYDGFIFPIPKVAKKMKEANFLWQIKDWEGYSHYIHNSFAVGRPMIVRRSDVKNKIFSPLFNESTCIYTDELERIRQVDQAEMANNCHRKFGEIVDFNDEEDQLRKFFSEFL